MRVRPGAFSLPRSQRPRQPHVSSAGRHDESCDQDSATTHRKCTVHSMHTRDTWHRSGVGRRFWALLRKPCTSVSKRLLVYWLWLTVAGHVPGFCCLGRHWSCCFLPLCQPLGVNHQVIRAPVSLVMKQTPSLLNKAPTGFMLAFVHRRRRRKPQNPPLGLINSITI